MSHNLSLTDAELFTISAALQVYHNTGPEFGRNVFLDHEELFPDDAVQEMEQNMVDLANHIGDILRERYPTPDCVNDMPDDLKRPVIFGMHVVQGSAQFRDLTASVLEQIVHQVQARNN